MHQKRERFTQLDSHRIERLTKKGRQLHDRAVAECLAGLFSGLTAGERNSADFSLKTGGRSVSSGTC